jgi:hypothetical protein
MNANSRQQFIIEEEGAYSQRSSSEDMKPRSRQGHFMQTEINNNSQNNLSSKGVKHGQNKS